MAGLMVLLLSLVSDFAIATVLFHFFYKQNPFFITCNNAMENRWLVFMVKKTAADGRTLYSVLKWKLMNKHKISSLLVFTIRLRLI